MLLTTLPPGRYAVAIRIHFDGRVIVGCAEVPDIILACAFIIVPVGIVKICLPLRKYARIVCRRSQLNSRLALHIEIHAVAYSGGLTRRFDVPVAGREGSDVNAD